MKPSRRKPKRLRSTVAFGSPRLALAGFLTQQVDFDKVVKEAAAEEERRKKARKEQKKQADAELMAQDDAESSQMAELLGFNGFGTSKK